MVKWFGHFIVMLVILLIPLLLFTNAVMFPVRVMLERDLQLNGKQTTARIVSYRQTYAKNGQAIHHCRVRFTVEGKTYLKWIICGRKSVSGEVVAVVYAPLFPGYVAAAAKRDPWNMNLIARALAFLFIGGASGIMAIGFYKRVAGQYEKLRLRVIVLLLILFLMLANMLMVGAG